jgi:hypothetical protein
MWLSKRWTALLRGGGKAMHDENVDRELESWGFTDEVYLKFYAPNRRQTDRDKKIAAARAVFRQYVHSNLRRFFQNVASLTSILKSAEGKLGERVALLPELVNHIETSNCGLTAGNVANICGNAGPHLSEVIDGVKALTTRLPVLDTERQPVLDDQGRPKLASLLELLTEGEGDGKLTVMNVVSMLHTASGHIRVAVDSLRRLVTQPPLYNADGTRAMESGRPKWGRSALETLRLKAGGNGPAGNEIAAFLQSRIRKNFAQAIEELERYAEALERGDQDAPDPTTAMSAESQTRPSSAGPSDPGAALVRTQPVDELLARKVGASATTQKQLILRNLDADPSEGRRFQAKYHETFDRRRIGGRMVMARKGVRIVTPPYFVDRAQNAYYREGMDETRVVSQGQRPNRFDAQEGVLAYFHVGGKPRRQRALTDAGRKTAAPRFPSAAIAPRREEARGKEAAYRNVSGSLSQDEAAEGIREKCWSVEPLHAAALAFEFSSIASQGQFTEEMARLGVQLPFYGSTPGPGADGQYSETWKGVSGWHDCAVQFLLRGDPRIQRAYAERETTPEAWDACVWTIAGLLARTRSPGDGRFISFSGIHQNHAEALHAALGFTLEDPAPRVIAGEPLEQTLEASRDRGQSVMVVTGPDAIWLANRQIGPWHIVRMSPTATGWNLSDPNGAPDAPDDRRRMTITPMTTAQAAAGIMGALIGVSLISAEQLPAQLPSLDPVLDAEFLVHNPAAQRALRVLPALAPPLAFSQHISGASAPRAAASAPPPVNEAGDVGVQENVLPEINWDLSPLREEARVFEAPEWDDLEGLRRDDAGDGLTGDRPSADPFAFPQNSSGASAPASQKPTNYLGGSAPGESIPLAAWRRPAAPPPSGELPTRVVVQLEDAVYDAALSLYQKHPERTRWLQADLTGETAVAREVGMLSAAIGTATVKALLVGHGRETAFGGCAPERLARQAVTLLAQENLRSAQFNLVGCDTGPRAEGQIASLAERFAGALPPSAAAPVVGYGGWLMVDEEGHKRVLIDDGAPQPAALTKTFFEAPAGGFVKTDRQDPAKANRLRKELLPRELDRHNPSLADELAKLPQAKALESKDRFDQLYFLEICEPSGVVIFAGETDGKRFLVYAPTAALRQLSVDVQALQRGDMLERQPVVATSMNFETLSEDVLMERILKPTIEPLKKEEGFPFDVATSFETLYSLAQTNRFLHGFIMEKHDELCQYIMGFVLREKIERIETLESPALQAREFEEVIKEEYVTDQQLRSVLHLQNPGILAQIGGKQNAAVELLNDVLSRAADIKKEDDQATILAALAGNSNSTVEQRALVLGMAGSLHDRECQSRILKQLAANPSASIEERNAIFQLADNFDPSSRAEILAAIGGNPTTSLEERNKIRRRAAEFDLMQQSSILAAIGGNPGGSVEERNAIRDHARNLPSVWDRTTILCAIAGNPGASVEERNALFDVALYSSSPRVQSRVFAALAGNPSASIEERKAILDISNSSDNSEQEAIVFKAVRSNPNSSPEERVDALQFFNHLQNVANRLEVYAEAAGDLNSPVEEQNEIIQSAGQFRNDEQERVILPLLKNRKLSPSQLRTIDEQYGVTSNHTRTAVRNHPRWREPRGPDKHDRRTITSQLGHGEFQIVSVMERKGRRYDRAQIFHVDPENGNAYFVSGVGRGGQQVSCITRADRAGAEMAVGAAYQIEVTPRRLKISHWQVKNAQASKKTWGWD